MVDRYDIVGGDFDVLPHTAGSFVDHDDYAALEARLRDAEKLLREARNCIDARTRKTRIPGDYIESLIARIDAAPASGSPETKYKWEGKGTAAGLKRIDEILASGSPETPCAHSNTNYEHPKTGKPTCGDCGEDLTPAPAPAANPWRDLCMEVETHNIAHLIDAKWPKLVPPDWDKRLTALESAAPQGDR